MRSGMTIRGIANRLRHLERRLGWSDDNFDDAEPPWQYEQLCALLGEPMSGHTPHPRCVLIDPRWVRWLRRTCPKRLEELKQAHARGEPAPRWEITTDDNEK